MLVPGGMIKRVVMQDAVVAIGNGNVMDCIDVASGASATFTAQVTGITTATITWEGTIDGTNWVAVLATPLTTGTAATTATANGIFRFNCLGLTQVRARISAWTSGTITVIGVLCANS